MKENKIKVLVYLPVYPGASWKGEGISQTIENIIASPENVEYTLLTSKHCMQDVVDSLSDTVSSGKLKIKTFGVFNNQINSESDKLKRILFLYFKISLMCNALKLAILSFLGVYKYDIVFVPTPLFSPIGTLIGKKLVTSFWDAFSLEFSGFSDYSQKMHLKLINFALNNSDAITTQSETNKNFLVNFYGTDSKKIFVINNGYPNFKSFITGIKSKNITQQSTAYSIIKEWGSLPRIRNHHLIIQLLSFFLVSDTRRNITKQLNGNVLHRLLATDSIKPIKIITISTQNRPYKQIPQLFKVLDKLVKTHSHKYRFKFVFTCHLQEYLFKLYPWAFALVHELNRISNKQLAIIYKVSNLVIHPSIVEGGLGTYPMFEAASVGTPSLSQVGRHMIELQKQTKTDIISTTIELFDVEQTCNDIMDLLTTKHKAKLNIDLINKIRTEWKDSRKQYEEIFIKIAQKTGE